MNGYMFTGRGGAPTVHGAERRERMFKSLFLLILIALIVGAAAAHRRSSAVQARRDVAACLTLEYAHRAECERAADRELRAAHPRAALDYLSLVCDQFDPATTSACNRMTELEFKVLDYGCRARSDAGPDAENLKLETTLVEARTPPLCTIGTRWSPSATMKQPPPHGLRDGDTWVHAGLALLLVHSHESLDGKACNPVWFEGARALDVFEHWGDGNTHVGWLTIDHTIPLNDDGLPASDELMAHITEHACEVGADGIGEAARSLGDKGPRYVLFRIPPAYREWRQSHRAHHPPGATMLSPGPSGLPEKGCRTPPASDGTSKHPTAPSDPVAYALGSEFEP